MSNSEPIGPKKDAVKTLRENFYKRKPKSAPKALVDMFRKKDGPAAKKDPKVAKDHGSSDVEL